MIDRPNRQRSARAQASYSQDIAPAIGRRSSGAISAQAKRATVERKAVKRYAIHVAVREHGTNEVVTRHRAWVYLLMIEPETRVIRPTRQLVFVVELVAAEVADPEKGAADRGEYREATGAVEESSGLSRMHDDKGTQLPAL